MPAPASPHAAEDELALWRRLERLQAAVARALDRRLAREHGLSAHGFALLEAIAAAESPPRMSDLAAPTALTPSGVTRLVERLERRGIVERVGCPNDARVTHVRLTEAGEATLRAARATHRAAVCELLRARFPARDLRELRRALERARPGDG